MLLYDYWFIQFDFPDNNGNPYQISGGKMVWNDTLRRNIPENWKVQSVISNCLSSVIKPGVKIFNTKTYLATADVKGTSISTGTIVDYDGRESRANMQPSINSVWFAKMKNSIKHLYLNKEMQPIISSSILSTGFYGLQCNEISFEYIASYVSNAYFEIHKDMLAHGATQEAVNNDDLAGVHIIIPEDTVLCAYHETTQAIYAQISKNVCENQELVKLRDWLLPMLMNGQANNPALFVSLKAPYERLKIGGIEVRLRNFGKQLGLSKVHPHKFRRTLATMAIDKGMPIEQLQQLLGHRKIDTTLQYAMVKQSNVKLAHRRYIG